MSGAEAADAGRLFMENREALSRYLIRFTGDPELAADLVQETFVRLLRKPPAAQASRAWLFRVAANLATDSARTSKRRRLLGARGIQEFLSGEPQQDAMTLLEAEDRQRVMQRALLTLSEKERTALLLREEGFKHHEIAAAIGAAEGSVGTLMARAIAKLVKRLDLQPGEDL